MPAGPLCRPSSFTSDSATLRRASSGYAGSTAGSFYGSLGRVHSKSRTSGVSDKSRGESLLEEEAAREAAPAGEGLQMSARARFGYLAQYFAVGLICMCRPAARLQTSLIV